MPFKDNEQFAAVATELLAQEYSGTLSREAHTFAQKYSSWAAVADAELHACRTIIAPRQTHNILAQGK